MSISPGELFNPKERTKAIPVWKEIKQSVAKNVDLF
jgi:hypothetical protein